mmetsp:Transcript_60228/g.111659  ORF Transcript_60228/g.111659 Transcript_60228/m.111659 type:complete len:663 (-) Transcript_60228:33-2021(-)
MRDNAVNSGKAVTIGMKEVARCACVFLQIIFFTTGKFIQDGQGEDPNLQNLAAPCFGVCILLSWKLFSKAASGIQGMRPNVEFLMALAMLGSLALGKPHDAALVATLVQLMDAVTWIAVQLVEAKLNSSIVTPRETVTLKGGKQVLTSSMEIGAVFIVRVGEVIVADGTIVGGKGAVNESTVTGEAMPVDKEKGAPVYSGSLLVSGFMEIRADKVVSDSFHNRVKKAVEDARASQSNTDLVMERFAAWYTPSVLLFAMLVGCWQRSLTQVLVIMVAGCPCSLLGAAPFVQSATLVVLMNRCKCLVKHATALESLARIRWLGVDKTGTLTSGRFRLANMDVMSEWSESDVHRWIARVELLDNHPLAHSLVESYTGCVTAYKGWKDLPAAKDFQREGQSGVTGDVDGRRVGIGNSKLLAKLDIQPSMELQKQAKDWLREGGVVLYVTVEDKVAALLRMEDTLRKDAESTISALRKLSITPVLLTGDSATAAKTVADAVGIVDVQANCLPEDKAAAVRAASWGQGLGQEAQKRRDLETPLNGCGPTEVGFIGDGLNDCPALALVNVGVVLQEVGPQAIADAASVILQGNLAELPRAVVIARRARWLVHMNIAIAFSADVAVMLIAAVYTVPLWLGVLADNGTLLLVLMNSLWPITWSPEEPKKSS